MNKRIALIFSIFLSFSLQAQSFNENQINEFECSPSEMSQVLERKNKDRFKQTTYKDFVNPYQQAVVQEVANEISEETGNPTSPSEVTADDLKDRGRDFSCLNIDASKIGENILAGVDALNSILTGGIKQAGDLIDNIMEDLSKGLCSTYAPYLLKPLEDLGERAKRKAEYKIRQDRILRLYDEGARDYLINEQIDETFGDKYNLLQWRDNKIDKDAFRNSVNSQWDRELRDLYDDFDDQVDEKIDNN